MGWQWAHSGFWARARVLAVFRGCGVLPAGRGGHPPHTGISDVTPLRPSASCSCSGTWCILLGATSGSEALIRRSQVWDPFPSVWLGVASLGDTDTCTYTETTGSERRQQAHTDTHIHTHPFSFTLLSSSYLLPGLCFLFPNTLLPQKSPKHTVYRPVCTLAKFPLVPSFGCLQNAGPEVGTERGATTAATENQPSPCLTTSALSLARNGQNY